jgi:hypothetical protein
LVSVLEVAKKAQIVSIFPQLHFLPDSENPIGIPKRFGHDKTFSKHIEWYLVGRAYLPIVLAIKSESYRNWARVLQVEICVLGHAMRTRNGACDSRNGFVYDITMNMFVDLAKFVNESWFGFADNC